MHGPSGENVTHKKMRMQSYASNLEYTWISMIDLFAQIINQACERHDLCWNIHPRWWLPSNRVRVDHLQSQISYLHKERCCQICWMLWTNFYHEFEAVNLSSNQTMGCSALNLPFKHSTHGERGWIAGFSGWSGPEVPDFHSRPRSRIQAGGPPCSETHLHDISGVSTKSAMSPK